MIKRFKNQPTINYWKFIIICLLSITVIKGYSQTLKTFADENTMYTYYIDSISGEKIKHGSYKSIEKKDTYSRIITGNFRKGLPNGIYTIEEKAEKNRHFYPNEYSETGYSKATINTENGMPNGLWTYNRSWLISDLIVNYVKRGLGKETIALSIQFCDGKPCGTFDCFYDSNSVFELLVKSNPFNLSNNQRFEAILKGRTLGQYNKNGFAIGKWTFDNGKIIVNFNNGVLIEVLEKFSSTAGKYIENNQDDELKLLSKKYSNNEIGIKDLRLKLVKADTIYMFEKTSFNFFNTDYDDFGKLVVLSRFQKPSINELVNLNNNGTTNKSSFELESLFEKWGFCFSAEEKRIYSQLVFTAKENEEREIIRKKNEEIEIRKSEEQKKKIEIIDRNNRLTFDKYKILQKEFQEIKELPTVNEAFVNSAPLYNNGANFEIFHSYLYNFLCSNIKRHKTLGEELGKINYSRFNPTYNYPNYSSITYSLDSIYHIDSLRIIKINEIYLPQCGYLKTIEKEYNQITRSLEQIDSKLFDASNIEKNTNHPELYNALIEILNSNINYLKSEKNSLKLKTEMISKLSLILNKTLNVLMTMDVKSITALKKASTVEEKQNIIMSN